MPANVPLTANHVWPSPKGCGRAPEQTLETSACLTVPAAREVPKLSSTLRKLRGSFTSFLNGQSLNLRKELWGSSSVFYRLLDILRPWPSLCEARLIKLLELQNFLCSEAVPVPF